LECGKDFLKEELDRIICLNSKMRKAYDSSDYDMYRE
jgi:hypothetical protein